MSTDPSAPAAGFVDADLAREALALALPMIEPAVRRERVSGGGFLHIVVLDPGARPGRAAFEQAILLEHSIGERARWDADYAGFARAKARLSWEHQLDSHRLQTTHAHLLRHGDSLLWGGVCIDGLVVACSGAHPWYDEAFATAVAGAMRALVKERHAAARAADRLWLDAAPPG
jgi:hypothetical protein